MQRTVEDVCFYSHHCIQGISVHFTSNNLRVIADGAFSLHWACACRVSGKLMGRRGLFWPSSIFPFVVRIQNLHEIYLASRLCSTTLKVSHDCLYWSVLLPAVLIQWRLLPHFFKCLMLAVFLCTVSFFFLAFMLVWCVSVSSLVCILFGTSLFQV